jgi:hypothetical protein
MCCVKIFSVHIWCVVNKCVISVCSFVYTILILFFDFGFIFKCPIAAVD